MSATELAKQDIKAEVLADRDPENWDQFNATISHVFTRESKKLNKQLNIN